MSVTTPTLTVCSSATDVLKDIPFTLADTTGQVLTFSPDGQSIAALASNGKDVVVLDASTLLINGEPGAESVAAALADAAISTVNLTEVVTKMIDIGIPEDDAWNEPADLVPVVVDFAPELCRRAAWLRMST